MAQTSPAAEGTAVRRFDPSDDAAWDAELEHCQGATFFHGSAWARVLKETYGFTPAYFAVRQSNRIQTLLPMMEVDSWLTGRRGVSLPFTDECEPLCADAASFKAHFQAAEDLAALRSWRYIECRGGLHLFGDASPSLSYFGHRLDLCGGEGALFERLDSSARRAIRKAEHSGLIVEFSRDIESVREFYKLLCKTRRRHGVPPQPCAFFDAIHRHILAPNKGWLILARVGRRPVAGAVYFQFGRTAIYKFGASDNAFQSLRANNLVMWEAIKHFAREGFENLDFGRTSLTNEGLRNFKLSWGTSERRIDYVRRDMHTGGYVVVGDAASGIKPRILRMLPDPILRLLGSALYKHVA
jgi:CelD/BcsL family acetyltransferase involved in cellulose biosynthesis